MDTPAPDVGGDDYDAIAEWLANVEKDPAAALELAMEDVDLQLRLASMRNKEVPRWERLLLKLRNDLPKPAVDAFGRSVKSFAKQAAEIDEARARFEARARDLAGVVPRPGDELLNAVVEFATRFVGFSQPVQADAVALFAMHTHAVAAAECSPRLNVRSAEKQSGKTRLLEVLELLVQSPLFSIGITEAALFRSVSAKARSDENSAKLDKKASEGTLTLFDLLDVLDVDDDAQRRTLLIDETDTIWGPRARASHEGLRAVVDQGYRRSGKVPRVSGKRVEEYSVFAATILAGLGRLPDTIADRSIPITLRRSPRGTVGRFRRRRVEPEAAQLRREMAVWAETHAGMLREADPDIPEALSDRAADIWEPLLAIAEEAGGDWPERARRAANALSAEQFTESVAMQILGDVRLAFDTAGADRMASADLVTFLISIPDAPWATFGSGRTPLDAYQLKRLLEDFEISPKVLRMGPKGEPQSTARGYSREMFEMAWASYLDGSGYEVTGLREEAVVEPLPDEASDDGDEDDSSS